MTVLHEVVLPKLSGIRKSGSGYVARCPAHEDARASLSLSVGDEHPVVLHCFAGCDRDAILDALGLTWSELCEPRERQPDGEWTPRGPAVAVYDYVDEDNNLLFQVCRTADKQFPQRRPDSAKKSGWAWNLGDVRRVLYRLPQITDAVQNGSSVFVCEGEKDVQAFEAQGAAATCCPGGAGKWREDYSGVFRGADVTVVADRDEPGQKHAREVAKALTGVAAAVRIVEAKAGKDAADHFAAGYTIDDFTETWASEDTAKLLLAPDLWEFIGTADVPEDWVVPGLLERGDRVIWTGFEGLGKSVALRQMAVCVAAGLHPFTLRTIPAKRVLLIDCENSERQSRRAFRKLGAASISSGHRVPEGGLRLIHRPEGIDLTTDDDAAWLVERVTAHEPDLLVIGPFYQLYASNINEETAARRTVKVINAARVKADCAVMIEAHAGHGEQGRNRSVRPLGSSLLLRWPEFGYGIVPDGDADPDGRYRTVKVMRWRGDRSEREWPAKLTWGDPWPWRVPEEPWHGHWADNYPYDDED